MKIKFQGVIHEDFPSVLIYLFLTSLLEYNCFTMLCQFLLYNKVNQLCICIYPHIPSLSRLPPTLLIPPFLSHPSRWSQSTELISLCYAAASHQLSICPSLPFPLPVSSSPFSTSASLFLSCHQVHQNHFFFQIPYICLSIRLFAFLFLTSLCMTDSRSIHLTTNNSISFLFMAE